MTTAANRSREPQYKLDIDGMHADKLVLVHSDNGVTLLKVTLSGSTPKLTGVTSYVVESNRTADVKSICHAH